MYLYGDIWTFANVEGHAFGQDGNDLMHLPESFRVPVELYGGAGNDVLNGGGGPSILNGGGVNDLIVGGKARNLLIGGLGSDILVGLGGDDILIADDFLRGTFFESQHTAARNVLSRWSATDSYTNRVTALKDNLVGLIQR